MKLNRWLLGGSVALVVGAVALACTEDSPNALSAPKLEQPAPDGKTTEARLAAELSNPSSDLFKNAAQHRATLAKAYAEVPGLREKLASLSATIAANSGVTGPNPRLADGLSTMTLEDGQGDGSAPADAGGAVADPGDAPGGQCVLVVSFAASYAHAWACRQCASGETVCAYAYAAAYAWALAWACKSPAGCGGDGGVDGGPVIDAGADPDASVDSGGPVTDAAVDPDASVDGGTPVDASPDAADPTDSGDPDSGSSSGGSSDASPGPM